MWIVLFTLLLPIGSGQWDRSRGHERGREREREKGQGFYFPAALSGRQVAEMALLAEGWHSH